MANNSNDITVTDARFKKALEQGVSHVINQTVPQMISEAVKDNSIRTGMVTKFYPYLDKAEVQLDNVNQKVLCQLGHRYVGVLIDFYTPGGNESYCEKLHEPCIIPFEPLYCMVVKLHEDDSDDYLLVDYYYPQDIVGFAPPPQGNMRFSCFRVSNEDYVQFGVNGLKIQTKEPMKHYYGEYEDDVKEHEVYTKEETYSKDEVDEKIKDSHGHDGDFDEKIYTELLNASEDYKQMSYENKYFLFRGDCWTINNNFESSAAITSETTTDFTVTGTFRTKQDLVGIYWNSEDLITHPYISYGKRTDYRNVVLEFDYTMTGCKDFSYNNLENHPVSVTIAGGNGETYYFNMFNFINNGHATIPFNNLVITAGGQYRNAAGELITVPDGQTKKVDASDIKFVMLVLIPENYDPNTAHPTTYHIMENVDFTCEITNIEVTNGAICEEHIQLEPHKYRICEGYDDFYNLNPHRVCKEMRKLGYVEWCDLYIGASHFYEKSGTVNDTIDASDFNHTRTEKMVLDKNVPLNKAFIAWLDCYSRELLANDCPNLVVSVSMENLQCPQSWRQKDCNGNYALTGWVPSTFFYSPCNSEVAPYMQSVSEACLDIVVANGMQPILQMGEAWWWWNENDRPNQPPCFYDLATRNKYHNEFGKNIPEYTSSWDANYDADMMFWLNKQLCEYSDSLRAVVKSDRYSKGLYMALFFPPSVTDVDRVPAMMQDANYLKDAYHPDKLDVLQIEDYDWVIWESPHHKEAYTIGQDLGFPEDRLHYFGGFVQYPEDARIYWRLIKQSMDDAIAKKFKEVYVWAGSQVRRDHKMIGYDKYELVQNLLK